MPKLFHLCHKIKKCRTDKGKSKCPLPLRVGHKNSIVLKTVPVLNFSKAISHTLYSGV